MLRPGAGAKWGQEGVEVMLQLAILLLVLSIVFGVFGFGGLAVEFAGIAQILFFVFVVLFLLSAVAGALRGRPPA